MFNEADIHKQINAYLSGRQSFEALEDWLVENSRVRYLDNPPAIRRVIDSIHHLMFQVIEGEIDESRFRDEARKFTEPALFATFQQAARPITLENIQPAAPKGILRRFTSTSQLLDWEPVRM